MTGFDIVMMNNTDPVNKITKNPTTVSTFTGTLVEGTSIVNPDILVDSVTVPSGNYCYISAFNRYYYVKDIVSQKNGLWRLNLHVDPLKSFATEILANDAIIARSTDTFNLYLEDSRYKAYADPIIVTKKFPSGFTTFQFVLALLGTYSTGS